MSKPPFQVCSHSKIFITSPHQIPNTFPLAHQFHDQHCVKPGATSIYAAIPHASTFSPANSGKGTASHAQWTGKTAHFAPAPSSAASASTDTFSAPNQVSASPGLGFNAEPDFAPSPPLSPIYSSSHHFFSMLIPIRRTMKPLVFCHLITLIPGLLHRPTPPTLLTRPHQLPRSP